MSAGFLFIFLFFQLSVAILYTLDGFQSNDIFVYLTAFIGIVVGIYYYLEIKRRQANIERFTTRIRLNQIIDQYQIRSKRNDHEN